MADTQLADIKQVCVIGGGTMGHGIAIVFAQSGYNVQLYDLKAEAIEHARTRIEKFTQKSVDKAKLSAAAREDLLRRISYTTEHTALRGELAIEAVLERLEVKHKVFGMLEEQLGPRAILATNTSSIPITEIGAGMKHPERLIGLHFFNPAPIMKLVEIIRGEATAAHLPGLMAQLCEHLGKTGAEVQDTPGFIVNRVARFYYLESLKILEEGTADHETIDRLMEAQGFPMGPFRLMDLIGVNTNHEVSKSMYESFFYEPRFRPSRIQQKKTEAGYHGRKSGRGFYVYTE